MARAVLQQLRLFGIRISIDDFGMGAANLETFLLLPFDELKIDRAFVSRMQHNDKARQIVESLIDFGRRMSIHTVAEGVEDAVTLRMLEKAACRIAQGYGLGRPARLDTFISSAIEQSREAAAGS